MILNKKNRYFKDLSHSKKLIVYSKLNIFRYVHSSKYINVYTELKYFLENNPVNEETQIKIEKFLLDNSVKEATPDEIGGLFSGIYSKKTLDFIQKFKPGLMKKIDNFIELKSQFEDSYTDNSKAKLVLIDIIETTKKPFILTVLLGRFIKILSNSRHNYTYEKNLVLDIALDLSKDLIRKYFSLKYKSRLKQLKDDGSLIDDEVFTFSDWKKENLSLVNDLEDGSFRVTIGVTLIEWLDDLGLITKKLVKLRTSQHNYYHSSEKLLNDWEQTLHNEIWTSSDKSNSLLEQQRNMLLTPSFRLPSIVKPKPYKILKDKVILGGYLLNDIEYSDPLILRKYTQSERSVIKSENIIYDTVNKINSVGYKINGEVLNFINLNSFLYKEEILTESHKLESKNKLTSKERKDLQKYISRKELQNHILSIADLFLNIPEFYFNNRIDGRGRLYCVTEYLNFQSTDLAKSLLLFSIPNEISRFDERSLLYFKVYGGNCYGNKIDKLSIEKKVAWVDENKDRIINYENGEIIQESENKLLFTAFCIEYKKWYDFYYNSTDAFFNTYLPIQLDASCNGFQHLVLLSGELNLRKELNLTQTDFSKNPYDFYSYVLELYKDYLNELDLSSIEDEEVKASYGRIRDFCLDRKIVKKVIMTIPYNATTKKMVEYITEILIKKTRKTGDTEMVWFSHPQDLSTTKELSYKDLYLLVNSIKTVLDKTSPKIAKLKDYLRKIAKICTELELHIPWLLPNGLEVKQSYLEETSVYLKPFSYSESRVKLSSYKKKKLDLDAQVRAFMPNLIHSLDATSLMLLIQKYFDNTEFSVKNIYTIHDCFAMPMNHVEFIIDNLRKVYISLYSDSLYLEKLDEGILNNISYHYRNVNIDREKNTLTIIHQNETKFFEYPNIKEVLGEQLPRIEQGTRYLLV